MELDLINTLTQKSNALDKAIKQLRKSAYDYAKARHDYRVAIATETLKLRDSGMKVTVISDIVRGLPTIAKLGMDEVIAKGIYEANIESIQGLKLQIRLLDAQIQREWNASGKGDL